MNLSRRDLGKIIFLSIMWSPSFIIVKLVQSEIPPFWLTTGRCLIAAVVLLIYLLFKKQSPMEYLSYWKEFVIAGLLLTVIGFTSLALAEKYIDSSTACLLEGMTPLFALLYSKVFIRTERFSPGHLIAVFLGFFGVMIISRPHIISPTDHQFLGIIFMFLMTSGFAAGLTYTQVKLRSIPAIKATTLQMIMTTLMLIPISIAVEPPWRYASPSNNALALILLLGIITALGWFLYYNIIRTTSATYASITTLIIPVITLFWSRILLNEAITIHKVIGAIFVLAALFMLSPFGKRFPTNKKLAEKWLR